jgi:hypothetical protein
MGNPVGGVSAAAWRSHAERLVVWLFFTVVFSVLPLVIDGLGVVANTMKAGDAPARSHYLQVFLLAMVGKGETLLVAGALCAAILGEMLSVKSKALHLERNLLAGSIFALGAFSCLLYPMASALGELFTAVLSAPLLLLSFLLAGAGVWLASVDREING